MSLARFAASSVGTALLFASLEHAALAARPEPAEKPIRTIAVAVNGEPLQTDTPPEVIDGRLLVPLREVFAALGIVVSRSGNVIRATLPTGNVTFAVNSSRATVDGRSVVLDAPVVDRDGTTYAPLRLLVVAFGASATYDQRGAKVEIVSAFVGRNSSAERARAGGGTDVQGVVSALDPNSVPPSLTVVRGGTSRTISITSDAKIWTEDVTIHSQIRGALADVRVGDAVHAILAKDGRVVSVFDFYKSTAGTISALSGASFVLQSGRVITPGGGTDISLNGAPAKLGDLKTGDYVTVRSNPESGELRQLVVSRALAQQAATPEPGSAAPVAIASIAIAPGRPLRSGETLDVTLHGTAGGHATFEISDYLKDLPMRETSPGTYVGRFTIPDRFNVTQVPVYGRLTVGGSSAPRTEAAQTLSATTTPPAIGEIAP